MGNRLSKIYTRTGDQGTTGLSNGNRVAKDCQRIEVIGSIDELNCAIGYILVNKDIRKDVKNILQQIQHKLFDLGGEISRPESILINQEDIQGIESILDNFNHQLPPLKEFILPGGDQAAASCHIARAICRRVERRLITLSTSECINKYSQVYINRLSDLLFVICRVLSKEASQTEILWNNKKRILDN